MVHDAGDPGAMLLMRKVPAESTAVIVPFRAILEVSCQAVGREMNIG
jgi:hypothetical protein